jgi:hypothetical protein
MLFLAILGYFTLNYFRLLSFIFCYLNFFYYCRLFHLMPLLNILGYINMGYLWLLYWWLLVPIYYIDGY